MPRIAIDWTNGRPRDGAEDDERRASAAAEAVLNAFEWRKGDPMKIDYGEAEAAYARHVSEEEYVRSPRETIMIAAWEAAQSAADIALTEGWHDPNGASCTIRVI